MYYLQQYSTYSILIPFKLYLCRSYRAHSSKSEFEKVRGKIKTARYPQAALNHKQSQCTTNLDSGSQTMPDDTVLERPSCTGVF